ncbi:unnamed protein product [Moneuplotes crassus]|uniref:Uncharacterized protein n=1 Tax=Euplotes crassus TaxID=5936 RepID=A0AAD2D4F7_EUPCR|nr:unnamed protein product [Moneuplotes crassus]
MEVDRFNKFYAGKFTRTLLVGTKNYENKTRQEKLIDKLKLRAQQRGHLYSNFKKYNEEKEQKMNRRVNLHRKKKARVNTADTALILPQIPNTVTQLGIPASDSDLKETRKKYRQRRIENEKFNNLIHRRLPSQIQNTTHLAEFEMLSKSKSREGLYSFQPQYRSKIALQLKFTPKQLFL